MLQGSASHLAGGLFNSVRQLSLSLNAGGTPVSVIAPHDPETEQDRGAWFPLDLHTPPRMRPGSLGLAPQIGKLLELNDPDVLHQHGIWQAFSAQATAWRKKTGRPVMIAPRGMLDPWALQNGAWKKRIVSRLFENANLQGADCLHALNASEAESMRAYGLRNPIAVIPNGMHPLAPDTPRPARPAWLPRDDKSTLLFLGRLHPKKGVSELVDAFAMACKSSRAFANQWRLAIVGWDDGGFAEAPQTQAARLGLEDSILFPGPLLGEDKDSAFGHCDAFVLPSHSEGLPMSVLEAWSHSVPVLMTQACNLPEGFAAGAAIRITTSPGELSEQLVSALLADLSDVARAGHTLATERFTWESIARRQLNVYKYLCSGGPCPDDILLP